MRISDRRDDAAAKACGQCAQTARYSLAVGGARVVIRGRSALCLSSIVQHARGPGSAPPPCDYSVRAGQILTHFTDLAPRRSATGNNAAVQPFPFGRRASNRLPPTSAASLVVVPIVEPLRIIEKPLASLFVFDAAVTPLNFSDKVLNSKCNRRLPTDTAAWYDENLLRVQLTVYNRKTIQFNDKGRQSIQHTGHGANQYSNVELIAH